MARLRMMLDQQLQHLQGVISKLANRLQRRVMAKQTRSWDFDLAEGILDAARLDRVAVTPLVPLSLKAEKATDFRAKLLTLMSDTSVPSRGPPTPTPSRRADTPPRTQ